MQNPAQQPTPANPNQGPQHPQPVTPLPGPYDNFALASLLIGTISILLSLFIYPGLALSIISVVFGIRGKESNLKGRLAKIGIVLGVIGFITSVFWGLMNLYLTVVSEL